MFSFFNKLPEKADHWVMSGSWLGCASLQSQIGSDASLEAVLLRRARFLNPCQILVQSFCVLYQKSLQNQPCKGQGLDFPLSENWFCFPAAQAVFFQLFLLRVRRIFLFLKFIGQTHKVQVLTPTARETLVRDWVLGLAVLETLCQVGLKIDSKKIRNSSLLVSAGVHAGSHTKT